MNNYIYIVAGLPDLVMNFEGTTFSYSDVKNGIMELLSVQDRKYVDLLEQGFDEATLNADFYALASKSKDKFIKAYFDFDLRLRNMKVKYLAKRLDRDPQKYLIAVSEADFEEAKKIQTILDTPDFVLREQQMDLLKWEKANEIVCFEYFNLDVILSFLVKAKMVQRWAEMDKTQGEEMFQKLVNEVRGTFQGIKYNDN
jgi:Protein of unknown function (DUF2764).